MRFATAALAVVMLSAVACRSHRAVETGLEQRVVAVDSVVAEQRGETMAAEAAEIIAVEFFAPDTAGRQAVRRVVRQRRLAEIRRADTTTVAATGRKEQQSTYTAKEKTEPTVRHKRMLVDVMIILTTLILLTLTIRKRR